MAQLDIVYLPGLKIQLIARLVKAVKEQSGEASKESPTTVTEDKSSHWKLQPEAQKRMNALIARMGIVEKDIPDLPDLASIVLRPAKGRQPGLQKISYFSTNIPEFIVLRSRFKNSSNHFYR